jgi:CHAT domain-containing protein
VVSAEGEYRLELKAANPNARPGRYELRIEVIRAATDEDRQRAEAERLSDEADALAKQPSAAAVEGAIAKNMDALAYFQSTGDKYRQGMLFNRIGLLRARRSDLRGAIPFYENAMALARESGDKATEASATNNKGGALDLEGDISGAMAAFEKAKSLFHETGDLAGEANTQSNIGKLYFDMADYQKAADCYRAALALQDAAGDTRRRSLVLQNLGNSYWLLDPERAVDYLEQALALARSSRDTAGEAQALGELAGIYNLQGRLADSIRSGEDALRFARAAGDRQREARALRTVGLAHARMGDASKGSALLLESIDAAKRVGNRRGEALSWLALGEAHQIAANSEEAARSFERSRAIAEEIGDRDTLANAIRGVAHAERDLGKLAEARRDAALALSLVETLRANAGDVDTRATYLSTAHEAYELYIDILMRQGDWAAALEASERSRARSLLDMLAEAGADIREGVDRQLLEREREIANLLNAKGARLLPLLGRNNPQAAALKQEIARLESDYRDVEAAIRKANPRYAALTQPSPLKREEIQSAMDPGSLLLEYSLGEPRSYLWAVSRSGLEAWELPSRARIEAASRNLLQLIAARAEAPMADAARQLSEMVLAPAAQTLAGKRLVIVADGVLQQVPFAMLPAPGSREPVIASHEIVSLPSVSAIAVLRKEFATRATQVGTLAIFADPVFDRATAPAPPETTRMLEHVAGDGMKLARLPFTALEADQILQIARGAANWKATGYEATRDAALSGKLGQYRYIHFATHGLLDTERPSLSALVLSQTDPQGNPLDGFLRVNDIYNLRLSADLVVLSACQTGLGKPVRGEGLMGLTRAFLYAGAPRVVVSLWSVNDRATAALMAALYRGMLRQGKTPAAALRAAQLEIRKQKQWESPYYWAAFVQHGEWR